MRSFLYLCSLVCLVSYTNAQSLEREVASTAGGYLSNSTFSLEYTMGETVVGEFTNSSVVLNQGFNQGTSSTVGITGLALSLNLKLYPNPASQALNVESDEAVSGSVINVLGQTQMEVSIAAGNSQLDVSGLTPGVYFLTLRDSDNKSYTFKWIKE